MFYEFSVAKTETFLAGKSAPSVEIKLRLDRTAIVAVSVLMLALLAVYSSWANWPDAAKEILKLGATLAGGISVGSAKAEKSALSRLSKRIRELY